MTSNHNLHPKDCNTHSCCIKEYKVSPKEVSYTFNNCIGSTLKLQKIHAHSSHEFNAILQDFMYIIRTHHKRSRRLEVCIQMFKYLGRTSYNWETYVHPEFCNLLRDKIDFFKRTESTEFYNSIRDPVSHRLCITSLDVRGT